MGKVATLIHLEPEMKQRLTMVARRKKTSVSEELRQVLAAYLEESADLNLREREQVRDLLVEAKQSIRAMKASLDRANCAAESAIRDVRKLLGEKRT